MPGMAQPTPYTKTANFAQDESNAVGGRSTVRTAALDAELLAAQVTLSQTLANLELVQRDDGALRDRVVRLHTLSPEVAALLVAAGVGSISAWLTGTSYAVKDVVSFEGSSYLCGTAHVAGVFNTDLNNGYWLPISSSEVQSVVFGGESKVSTAGQTVFTLDAGSYTLGNNSLRVFVDGLKMTNGSDYVETSATQFTFLTPLPAGRRVDFDYGRAVTSGFTSDQVGHTPTGAGAVSHSVGSILRRTVNVRDFATDATTDFTAALSAAVAVLTAGGGTVRVPAGVFNYSAEVQIPPYVNIVGEGKGATILRSTTSGARLYFTDGATDGRGGMSGGFTLNGNRVAENLLRVDLGVERSFRDVLVTKSSGDGILLYGTQNATFYAVDSQDNVGCNLVLDYGAGNNRWFGGEFNRCGEWSIKFDATSVAPDAGDDGVFSEPTNNIFYGLVVERLGYWTGSAWSDEDLADGLIYHRAGRFNGFVSCSFALPALNSTSKSLVLVEKATAQSSILLTFDNIFWSGTPSRTTALEVRADCSVVLNGRQNFESHTAALSVADTGSVTGVWYPTLGSVTSYFVNQGGGTQPQQNLLLSGLRQRLSLQVPAGFAAVTARADSAANAGTEIYPGSLRLGAGSAAANRVIQQASAYGIDGVDIDGTTNPTTFLLRVGAIDLIVTNTTPTQAAPNGSIGINTAGGTGTTLYVRESGAWVAK